MQIRVSMKLLSLMACLIFTPSASSRGISKNALPDWNSYYISSEPLLLSRAIKNCLICKHMTWSMTTTSHTFLKSAPINVTVCICTFIISFKITFVWLCVSNGRSVEAIWPRDTRCYISGYLVLEAWSRLSLWMPVMALATGTNTNFLDGLYNNQATIDTYIACS